MRARITALLLTLSLTTGVAVTTAAPAQAATGDSATVFSLTNAQRAKAGVKPLISDAALDKAAKAWAQQLASSCTFEHSSSSWRAARVSGAGWAATGENIAAGYSTPGMVVNAWMASPGHKANILNSRYTGVGIGFAKGSCYSSYWVQIFGWTKTAAAPGAGDVNGDFTADVVARNSAGQLLVYRGNGKGGWGARTAVASGWAAADKLVTLGDFTGDGVSDLGRVRASDGAFFLYKGTGSGTYAAPRAIGSGWGSFRKVIGGLDVNGDRRTDVLAVTAAGNLMLYRGNGKGGWSGQATKVGSGWGSARDVFYVGDFNGDTRGDLMTRRTDGSMWLYPTTGTGSFGTAKRVATGWGALTAVFSPGDFDGSGKPDVLTRRSDGTLVLHRGNGKGGWGSVSVVGTGWNGLTAIG